MTNLADPILYSFRRCPYAMRARLALAVSGTRCELREVVLRAKPAEMLEASPKGTVPVLVLPGGRVIDESLWRGECFVFDERVTVRHGLAPGTYELCRACRRPVSPEGRASPLFEEGASCADCYGERTEEERESYRERHRQEALAAARGEAHIGATYKKHRDDQPG